MKNSHQNRPNRSVWLAALALATTLATSACTDATGTGSRTLKPGNPNFAVLQDENLVPVSDFSNPGFLEPFGSLWSQLDEDVPNDDTDYIWRYRSGLPPTNSEASVNLSSPSAIPSPSQTHTLRVRWKVVGNYSNNTPQPTMLTFQLIDVTNGVVGTGTSIPTGNNYIDVSTTANPNLITDYNALRVRLNVQLKPVGTNQIQARITWVRLEIR